MADSVIGLYEFAAPVEVLRARAAKFVEEFRRRGARRVLDVGCGRGLFLEALRDAGIEAHGLDLSQASVDECHRKGFPHVICGDALAASARLADEGQRFDGIYCSHLIEHIPVPQAEAWLRDACRLLNDGGTLIVITPNPANFHVISEGFWLDPTHIRPYPALLLARMLTNSGLTVERAGDDPDTRREPVRWQRARRRLGGVPGYVWDAFTCGEDQFCIAVKAPRP